MNIDEKIAEYKADIEKCERVCAVTAIGSIREMAKETAKDCRQMVEWLEELKQLREQASSSEEPNKWIPLTKRPLTVKECGEYVEGRTLTETMLLNCPLPKDGQWVLISHSDGYVHTDIFHNDEGACYFEGFDIDEVEAWMPLPPNYKAERENKND